MTTTASTTPQMVVKVENQRFQVPAETSIQVLRDLLVSWGFPNVASARVKEGTEDINGVTTRCIEFIKQAGTKGTDSLTLATVLAQARPWVPPPQPTRRPRYVRLPADMREAWFQGTLALEQALDHPTLEATLEHIIRQQQTSAAMTDVQEIAALCQALYDLVPAAATHVPCGW